jgi:hypothetical protein
MRQLCFVLTFYKPAGSLPACCFQKLSFLLPGLHLQAAAWRAWVCCLSSWHCCAARAPSAGRTMSWPPLLRCGSVSRCVQHSIAAAAELCAVYCAHRHPAALHPDSWNTAYTHCLQHCTHLSLPWIFSCLLQEEEDAADYASGLAGDLFSYKPQHVLAGQYMFDDWDPALVGGRGWARLRGCGCCGWALKEAKPDPATASGEFCEGLAAAVAADHWCAVSSQGTGVV